jgi:hypothetical protein
MYNVVGMKYFKAACFALLLLTILSISALFPPAPVVADSFRYAYVDRGVKAYFCEKKDENSSVFAIPETYCVEILSEEGDWYYCRYAKDEGAYSAIYGYCLKNKLTLTDEPLENEYLNLPIAVKFRAENESPYFPFEIELTLPFYGEGTLNAANMTCVYYNGRFRYVAEPVPDYVKNPLPQPTVSTGVTEPNGDGTATIVTAVVITVVAVVAVAVLYFVGKRPKLPPKIG